MLSWLLPALGMSYSFPQGVIRDNALCQHLGEQDTSHSRLLKHITSYPAVFLAEEIRYVQKADSGKQWLQVWDTLALGYLLGGPGIAHRPEGSVGFGARARLFPSGRALATPACHWRLIIS